MENIELESLLNHKTIGKEMTTDFQENLEALKVQLLPEQSYDVVYRVINVGGRDACFFFIDGFCKDELMQKLLQYLMDLKAGDLPENAHDMTKEFMPYVEVDLSNKWNDIIRNLLSGQTILVIDGYDTCIMIDSRTYHARSVSEPVKEKALRG